MIIKNKPDNGTFTRKAQEAINQEAGLRSLGDRDWNGGRDIRIEVGTVNAPFIVITNLTAEEGFDLHARMTQTELDIIEIEEMKYRMESLDRITSRLYHLVEEFRPT